MHDFYCELQNLPRYIYIYLITGERTLVKVIRTITFLLDNKNGTNSCQAQKRNTHTVTDMANTDTVRKKYCQ